MQQSIILHAFYITISRRKDRCLVRCCPTRNGTRENQDCWPTCSNNATEQLERTTLSAFDGLLEDNNEMSFLFYFINELASFRSCPQLYASAFHRRSLYNLALCNLPLQDSEVPICRYPSQHAN